MGRVIKQYDVFLVDWDPAQGHEIPKTRPCVVISPDEMNANIGTFIVAPMTTKSKTYPSRIEIIFDNKQVWIILVQIRTTDKSRLVKKMGAIQKE